MKDNVEILGIHAGDGKMMSPAQTLQTAIDSIGKKGALKNGKKLIVLALDDTDENFQVGWFQCGMSMSQCVAVSQVASNLFLKEMNY